MGIVTALLGAPCTPVPALLEKRTGWAGCKRHKRKGGSQVAGSQKRFIYGSVRQRGKPLPSCGGWIFRPGPALLPASSGQTGRERPPCCGPWRVLPAAGGNPAGRKTGFLLSPGSSPENRLYAPGYHGTLRFYRRPSRRDGAQSLDRGRSRSPPLGSPGHVGYDPGGLRGAGLSSGPAVCREVNAAGDARPGPCAGYALPAARRADGQPGHPSCL